MQKNIVIQFSEIEFKELIKTSIKESIIESESKDERQEDKFLSVDEAAKHLNLARQTLYGFTSKGEIPFLKRGKKLYFKRSELDKWINEGKKN